MSIFWLLLLLLVSPVWADPDQTISTPNTFVSNTTAKASEVNANFNEHQSKFNTHSHQDITQTTNNSFEIGNATTTGNKRLIADTGAASKPEIRYNTTSSTWQRSDDGTTFTDLSTAGGLTGGTPALTASTINSAGVATTGIRTDATIAVYDGTVPVTQAFGDTAATGSSGFAARRDHVHGMPANPTNGVKANTTFAPTLETVGANSPSANTTVTVTPSATSTVIIEAGGWVGAAGVNTTFGLRRTSPSASDIGTSSRDYSAVSRYVVVTAKETSVASGTARTYAFKNYTGGSGVDIWDSYITATVVPE